MRHFNFKRIAFLTIFMVMTLPTMAFATANYGENFGKWALDQLFYVVVVALALALIGCVAKRNITGLIVTLLIGLLVIAVIKDPEGLKNIATAIWNVIKG